MIQQGWRSRREDESQEVWKGCLLTRQFTERDAGINTVNNNGWKDANGRKKTNLSPCSNKPKRREGNNSARLIETIEVTFKDAFSHGRRGPSRLSTITANSFRAAGFICERKILGSWTNSCRWGSSRTWR